MPVLIAALSESSTRIERQLSMFELSLISVVPTFLLGVIVLASFVGFKSAFLVGVSPFIFSEFAKCFVLALFLHKFLNKK